MGIGEVRPDDETYRVVVKVEKPVALRWHYDGEVTVDGLGFEIRQPEGRMISYIAGAATLTNEMHVQIGHRDRAGSLLPDERHGYLLAETSASIEHTITSMFYFTKDLEATLSGEHRSRETSTISPVRPRSSRKKNGILPRAAIRHTGRFRF